MDAATLQRVDLSVGHTVPNGFSPLKTETQRSQNTSVACAIKAGRVSRQIKAKDGCEMARLGSV